MTELFQLKDIEPNKLKSEKNRILKWLKELIPDALVMEVGSTAVRGAIGKEDIDILVRVEKKNFVKVRDILDKQFERNLEQISNSEFQGYCVVSSLDVAIQLTIIGSQYDSFERFLNILKTDPSLLKKYNDIKRKWNGKPMDEYRQAKSDFIESVLLQNSD